MTPRRYRLTRDLVVSLTAHAAWADGIARVYDDQVPDVLPVHRQQNFRVRMEWGPAGASALAHADVAVIVDVLSFTTTVSVAVERGIAVYPFQWRDTRAQRYAGEIDAVLAVSRLERRSVDLAPGVSLSPVSMAEAAGIERVVLPSPNGSAVASGLADADTWVVAAALRNATAVGTWIADQLPTNGTVSIIASGERWPDGSLRPAIEDLWGAGAVITVLAAHGIQDRSPEARMAAVAFDSARGTLRADLLACSSGRELVEQGFRGDVDIAADFDRSRAVPVLRDGAFVDEGSR